MTLSYPRTKAPYPTPDSNDAAWAVVGVLVHVRQHQAAQVAARIQTSIANAEVHAKSANGKLVVTLEAFDASDLGVSLSQLAHIEGVICATPVYQHTEPFTPARELPL